MTQLQSGQRFVIPEQSSGTFRFSGLEADRIAVAAICPRGTITPFAQASQGEWYLSTFALPSERYEIIAYITDDRLGGFVNSAYPLSLMLDGQVLSFPAPLQQLAAVIVGEIYIKDGRQRIKVSNEGFTFGIDAYLRARNMAGTEIPNRKASPAPDMARRPSPTSSPPRGPSGTPVGTGSGVIVGPNLVITNAHVIEDGNNFLISRSNAVLTPIAVDPAHDLALLQGQVGGAPLPIRLTSPIWLGENVMASGYPLMDLLGADLKVTTGNISGLTGKMGDVSRFQFTAPIASGSSGGAVIDEFGNLVGITSASLAHDNMRERGNISENVNFGIRASLVYEIVAATGMPLPSIAAYNDGTRREAVDRLRNSVVSILVLA